MVKARPTPGFDPGPWALGRSIPPISTSVQKKKIESNRPNICATLPTVSALLFELFLLVGHCFKISFSILDHKIKKKKKNILSGHRS